MTKRPNTTIAFLAPTDSCGVPKIEQILSQRQVNRFFKLPAMDDVLISGFGNQKTTPSPTAVSSFRFRTKDRSQCRSRSDS
jgi:hypothetical protein